MTFLRLFYFSLLSYSNKNFFCNFCYQRLKSIEKKCRKFTMDVKFFKQSIFGVTLATQGFPNLKIPKTVFFHYSISHSSHFKNFFYACKNLFLVYFQVPKIISINANVLEFPAKTRVNIVRALPPLDLSDSYHTSNEHISIYFFPLNQWVHLVLLSEPDFRVKN